MCVLTFIDICLEDAATFTTLCITAPVFTMNMPRVKVTVQQQEGIYSAKYRGRHLQECYQQPMYTT